MENDPDIRRWERCRAQGKAQAYRMSYDQRIAFLKKHKWTNDGHWDNWFDPRSGWNYCLFGATQQELANQFYERSNVQKRS